MQFFANRSGNESDQKAATMVPSRTPFSSRARKNEAAAAMTAIETSNAIFVTPNSVSHLATTARTKDSPGSMTTSASTSM